MPYFKTSQRNPPLSTLLDIQTQKCGQRGTVFSVNGNEYTGEWQDNKKHGNGTQGYGKYFYNNSAVYEGEWSEDLRSGWGRMCHESGDIYEGEWMNDKNHGQGIIRFANGNWYKGSWRDGKKNGNGKFYYSEKGQLYEGFWVDGVAKCGTLSDFGRNEAPTLTKYPIPQIQLVDMQLVLREAQSAYTERINSKFPLHDTLTDKE
ncbi:MORN repeat-containing protein 3 isoform X2 [Centropristis striata]|uniref:MORN repeat-containing protein 3 isoform X2 n=1 Tax=Centropristis striata TaxID=184440 RepID=UPI0027E0E813|nr:MORN repeat-containing protein 3 isoform X2 [Centropristis striata]